MRAIADGYYRYQSPLDAYGNGGFRFADMSHKGSMLCLPAGMYKWDNVNISAAAVVADFNPVWNCADEIDVFLLGTGEEIVFVNDAIRSQFRERDIILEPMSTGAAVRTYNVLLGEGRAVAAGLVAIDRA